MNHRNRLRAATMLALLTPVLAADQFALAKPEPATPLPPMTFEGTPDPEPSPIMEMFDRAEQQLSYPAVDVSKFTATPSQPIDDHAHADVAHSRALGLDASTFGQPAIIMPIQPYPFAPPAYDMTALVPRRRRGRTPWRKAQRGW